MTYCPMCAQKEIEISELQSALRACPRLADNVLRACNYEDDREREIATEIRDLILAEIAQLLPDLKVQP